MGEDPTKDSLHLRSSQGRQTLKVPHLVNTLNHISLAQASTELSEAHDYLVDACLQGVQPLPQLSPAWGITVKRQVITLPQTLNNGRQKPKSVGKPQEAIGEIVNMVATIERLLDGLLWFQQQPKFQTLQVRLCHPSTSSTKGTNDLMLEDSIGKLMVLCEVSDIISGFANKEKRDLKNLGVANKVPFSPILPHRFLCVSTNMANFCTSIKRPSKTYNYLRTNLAGTHQTVLLEVVP